MNKCPYCNKEYKTLQSLATHLGICILSNGEYVVSRTIGLLHYLELHNKKRSEIIKKYPSLSGSKISSFKKTFLGRGIDVLLLPEKVYVYYPCPCCGIYAIKSGSLFKNWKSVALHLSKCIKNLDNKYYCDSYYGPLSIDLFNKYSSPYLKTIYPLLTVSPKHIRTILINNPSEWTKEELVEKALYFYEINNRYPITKDYEADSFYPSLKVIYRLFNSWEKYITFCGLNYIDLSFGIKTKALDGQIYRSIFEAVICNKFLFSRYKYEIEPKYPEQYPKWLYDWYIPELTLYIEAYGGLRPERLEEKIEINKLLNRKLLVITQNDLRNFKSLEEIVNSKI
jgi:hypothetical protein